MLLTACTLAQGMEIPTTLPTSRPTLPPSTLVSTTARDVHSIATASPAPTATMSSFDCSDLRKDKTTDYNVTAEMQYARHYLKVAETITYTNITDKSLSTIVLNVKPNWQAGIFKLSTAELANGESLKTSLVKQRLEIELPQPLDPSCTLNLNLNFDLHIPPIDTAGLHAYQGYLGYSARQTNLGQWLPVVAAHDGVSWISHEEFPIGEQDALDRANWDIHFHIIDATESIQIASPGTVEHVNNAEWHFSLPQMRDFSLSIGTNYRLQQQKTNSGINVELYSFDDAIIPNQSSGLDSGAYALNTVVKSVNLYETLYGAYPLKRLVIVEGDFPDGMEFSGIVFVGGEYFRGLNGVESYLTIISVHEVAHQWWYGKVGSDQAIYPWLDEALATYSELVFIEKYYPTLADWWWNFRVNRLAPQGYVDSTVYEFTTRRAYINAVYLRGVKMLAELRTELGDDVFFGWLNRYASENSDRLVTPQYFWSLLTSEQYTRTESIRQTYLRQPQVIASTPSTCTSETPCTP